MREYSEKLKTQYVNISLTAYRAIKVLKMLIEKPCSNAEIIENLKADEITRKSTSDDTLRVTINSLKAVGCKISRPSPTNNFNYVLKSHPFKVSFEKAQIKILSKIRKDFVSPTQWKEAIEINRLFEKIIALSGDEELNDLWLYKKPFGKVKAEILDILASKDLKNKKIVMTYKTSSKKTEVVDIVVDSVFCEAERLYILGWYAKRQSYSYFNAEKIVEIHSIEPVKSVENEFVKAVYKVLGDEMKTFECKNDERIICREENFILVESTVKSEFKFFQQLLALGRNFEIIEPDILKKHLAQKISKMRERYR